MIKKNKGFTILETLITAIIFSVIAMIFFLVFRLGLKYWKETDVKLQSEKSISLTTLDLNYAIRNTKKSEIQTNILENGNAWIAMNSASNGEYKGGKTTINENDVNCIIEENATELIWGLRILYFTAKTENECKYCKELNLTKVCPHKILVKRYYALNDEYKDLELLKYNNEADYSANKLKFDILTKTEYSRQSHDRILARNVIAFVPQIKKNGVRYSLKIFTPQNAVLYSLKNDDFVKTISAMNDDKDGELEDSISSTSSSEEYYDDATKDPINKFTTLINFTAVPVND
ncbi:type II secretion system protein [bacterium]|nr:type II secretion system protein [bacterium]